MFSQIARACALAVCLFVAGCASSRSRSLPRYQQPLARAALQQVRTTAYTHSEADHLQHGRCTALGTTLRCGPIQSAAADWSRWPAGTVFRIRETGQVYCVEDYGWALAGTNTIDLYKPSRAAMNAWGVRFVTIENLQWGSVQRSLAILRPRSKHKHVRRMIDQIEDRYTQLQTPAPTMIATTSAPSAPAFAAAAQPFTTPGQPRTAASTGVKLTPFR